jgi:hypothetical protein
MASSGWVRMSFSNPILLQPQDLRQLAQDPNRVRTLRADPLYRGHWLHVSVEHDEPGVFIVTTYRPLVSEWRTERARR